MGRPSISRPAQHSPRRASRRADNPELASDDKVNWKGRIGVFRRNVGNGEHAEIVITERVYRARISELG